MEFIHGPLTLELAELVSTSEQIRLATTKLKERIFVSEQPVGNPEAATEFNPLDLESLACTGV